MLKVGFIGAGGRAQDAHYPTVYRMDGVSVPAGEGAPRTSWRRSVVRSVPRAEDSRRGPYYPGPPPQKLERKS